MLNERLQGAGSKMRKPDRACGRCSASQYAPVACCCCRVHAQGKTVGIIGAGRIGTAYARMMAEGHKCNIVYYDPYPNKKLEAYMADYSK